MKHPGRWSVGILAVVFLALLPFSVEIVNESELTEQQQSEELDPAAYVDEIWESKLVPTVEDNAKDLATVLSAMDVDAGGRADKEQLVNVANEFGTITVGEAHVYLARGTGTVASVSPTGLMVVELDGYDGPIEVSIYVGTRIPSDETAVRDGVGFVNFGDFKDQTEYGKVGSEINKRIVSDVLAPLADVTLEGEQVSFVGAVGIRTFNLVGIDLSTVKIVPIRIEVGG